MPDFTIFEGIFVKQRSIRVLDVAVTQASSCINRSTWMSNASVLTLSGDRDVGVRSTFISPNR
jgi:hypothetical protein